MRKLLDIYPEYAVRRFEFFCIIRFTPGSSLNWHMLCSYIFALGTKNDLVNGHSFRTMTLFTLIDGIFLKFDLKRYISGFVIIFVLCFIGLMNADQKTITKESNHV